MELVVCIFCWRFNIFCWRFNVGDIGLQYLQLGERREIERLPFRLPFFKRLEGLLWTMCLRFFLRSARQQTAPAAYADLCFRHDNRSVEAKGAVFLWKLAGLF